MQRIKKKQNNTEGNTATKTNKSSKVADLVKELENNMQKRGDNLTEGDENVNDVFYENKNDDNENVINVLKNQQLSKSTKKKKTGKTFDYDDDE